MTMMITKQQLADLAMKDAIDWLNAQGIRFLPKPGQLKIGPINFWPGRGTITVDGDAGKRPENGLEGLKSLLDAAKADVEGKALAPQWRQYAALRRLK